MDKKQKLEACLIKLNEVNQVLEDLASKSRVIGQWPIIFAKTFIKHKEVEGKPPSDETAKQKAFADSDIAEQVQSYFSIKFKLDIYLELSRNLRKEIDSLRGAAQEDMATNGMFQ